MDSATFRQSSETAASTERSNVNETARIDEIFFWLGHVKSRALERDDSSNFRVHRCDKLWLELNRIPYAKIAQISDFLSGNRSRGSDILNAPDSSDAIAKKRE